MQRAAIERLLPEVLRRTSQPGSPLCAVLEAMEDLHRPVEEVLDHLEGYFHPYHAPENCVPFLARWVDLGRLVEEGGGAGPSERLAGAVGTGRLRELIAAAASLSRWRGTARGLCAFLETATGLDGFAIEEGVPGKHGEPRPFHVKVRAPKEALPFRRLIERIVELEKPAYVTYETEFGPPPR